MGRPPNTKERYPNTLLLLPHWLPYAETMAQRWHGLPRQRRLGTGKQKAALLLLKSPQV
jgi:hypothetical protein